MRTSLVSRVLASSARGHRPPSETAFDIYGKLLPGNEAEAGAMLDRLLDA